MIKVVYDPKKAVAINKTYQVDCDTCGCIFECEKEDVFTGAYGCAYAVCPCCGERAYIEDEDLEKNITPENLVYPDDFWVSRPNEIYHIPDDDVRGMIDEVVHRAVTSDEYFHFTEKGDRMVMTLLDDENILSVYVMQPVATTELRLK